MDIPSSVPPDIARRTGPLLFGPLINWMLYGILCVQAYVYSYNFPDDRRALKFIAYFVFVLETVQTALTGSDIYFWFVAGFGNMDRLWDNHFSSIDDLLLDAPISLIVQGLYCYRIWALNKQWLWLCVVIAFLSVAQAIANVWGGIYAAIFKTFVIPKPVTFVWFITSTLADILIAGAMTLLLRQMRSCGGRYSSYVLPRVVRLTIETNTLTTAVSIIAFILYVCFPNDVFFAIPATVLGKLYSNTLFLTLNNRIYFRDHPPPGNFEDSTFLSSNRRAAASSLHFAQSTPRQTVVIGHMSVRLNPTPPTSEEDTEKGNGDVATIDSDPSELDKVIEVQ